VSASVVLWGFQGDRRQAGGWRSARPPLPPRGLPPVGPAWAPHLGARALASPRVRRLADERWTTIAVERSVGNGARAAALGGQAAAGGVPGGKRGDFARARPLRERFAADARAVVRGIGWCRTTGSHVVLVTRPHRRVTRRERAVEKRRRVGGGVLCSPPSSSSASTRRWLDPAIRPPAEVDRCSRAHTHARARSSEGLAGGRAAAAALAYCVCVLSRARARRACDACLARPLCLRVGSMRARIGTTCLTGVS
jgi:hypothetical protein